MSPTAPLLLLALCASAALAMPAPTPAATPAAQLEARQFTFTVATAYSVPTSPGGTFIASASGAAAFVPVIGGTAAGEIVTASSHTLFGGHLAGNFGPASGTIGGTVVNPQGGGTATGCIGGAVGPAGYTQCEGLPFPKETDLGQG